MMEKRMREKNRQIRLRYFFSNMETKAKLCKYCRKDHSTNEPKLYRR